MPLDNERQTNIQWAVCWAIAAALLIAGWFLCEFLDSINATSPHSRFLNVTYYIFGAYDRILLLPLAIVAGLMYALWTRPVAAGATAYEFTRWKFATLVIGGFVFLITAVGTYLICQDFPLPMDEYFARLQVDYFRSGHLVGNIAPEWQPYAKAMTSPLLGHDPVGQTWVIGYHPVYSIMRLVFGWVGLESLTNAFLSGACVWLVALAARRLWPNDRNAPLLSVILLASSAQFLVYGMTSYSMQAHLCLNLAWLILFLSPSTGQRAWAPWIGVLALGLQQPNVHALFVAPFLFRLVWERRWRWAIYNAAVYLAGIAVWILWMQIRMATVAPVSGAGAPSLLSVMADLFTLPGRVQFVQLLMYFDLLLAWSSLLLVTLGGLAILRYRHLDAPLFDLAVGLVLAAAFYLFFGQGQGHGWGYRYLHPYFGNLVLLAVAGYRMIEGGSPVRAVKLQRLLVASTLLAVLVQIPFRLWEVREFTMPFASAYRYLKSLPVDVVIIKEQDTWYARDLVRNSPDAGTRPKIMSMERLSGQDARQLAARYKVQFVDHAQLSQFGLFEIQPRNNGKP